MRERIATRFSPQQKLIQVNKRLGNPQIEKQQGSSRILYDSLPLDGRTTFNFFEDSNARTFPFTNLGNDGGKLQVGESMALQRFFFAVVQTDGLGDITDIDSLFGAGLFNLEVGEMDILTANNRTLKKLPILSANPQFNKNAAWDDYNNFEFDTLLTLPPLLQFFFALRVNAYTPVANAFLRLQIEGVGSLINTRGTF